MVTCSNETRINNPSIADIEVTVPSLNLLPKRFKCLALPDLWLKLYKRMFEKSDQAPQFWRSP
jgi:hypothetical protein